MGAERPGHHAPVRPLVVAIERHAQRRGHAHDAQHDSGDDTHPTRARHGQPAGDEQRARRPDREHVARQQVVEPDRYQQQAEHEPGERESTGHQRSRPDGPRGPQSQQHECQYDHRDRHRLEHAVRRPLEPARELGHDLAEPPPERRVRDPVAPTGAVLADRKRDQAEPAHADHCERDLHSVDSSGGSRAARAPRARPPGPRSNESRGRTPMRGPTPPKPAASAKHARRQTPSATRP